MKCLSIGAAALLLAGGGRAPAATDIWELPPMRYSERQGSDAGSRMARQLAAGEIELPAGGLARLKRVLELLEVPEASQVLVFSKTSLQNERIGPRTPRALYFSPDASVGWVPGGDIEMITQDRELGPVFHVLRVERGGELRMERENSCFSCHGTTRTENVPGLLVRSVFPDAAGQPILRMGSFVVDHRTPFDERWGGYWVTGRSGLPHLGNRVFREGGEVAPEVTDLQSLEGEFDVSRYPRPTSDVVALMVLEHQCRAHNLFTAAGIRYRRARFLAQTIDPGGDPDAGSAGRVAERAAEEIVGCLLFRDEAELGEEVEGDEEFQRAFAAQFPRAADGSSLADFRLFGRLFKNRCSFMVYSGAFAALPERVRSAVLERMRELLAGGAAAGEFGYLKGSERRRIARILEETLPGFRGE